MFSRAYTYTLQEGRGSMTWYVTLAQEIVAQGGLDIEEVVREQQQHIATHYDITEAKVARAHIGTPGIAAPFIWQGNSTIAPPGIVYILIDGTHRAVRAYRERKPFYCYVLSPAQSRACLLSGPSEVIP